VNGSERVAHSAALRIAKRCDFSPGLSGEQQTDNDSSPVFSTTSIRSLRTNGNVAAKASAVLAEHVRLVWLRRCQRAENDSTGCSSRRSIRFP
jgi:hypothetical protein